MTKQVFHKLLFLFALIACSKEEVTPDSTPPDDSEVPEVPTAPDVYVLPVVVHVLHNGEEIGEGPNISFERIERQIEILNEDFRREEGSRGFNDHSNGGDARIEFVLAKQDPDGNPTNGITPTKMSFADLPDDVVKREVDQMGFFSYWNSEDYINIWTAPYGEDAANVILGSATGPDTDLPGDDAFAKPIPGGPEGIVINWWHFGETDLEGDRNLGRTLTHEMGHYLGLLHTWGKGECDANDYCDDTPAVDAPVSSPTPYIGCAGEEVMIANYMNWTSDHVMNVFTNDQISRMHHVLENSARRTSLLTSKGLVDPD